jgi:cell wall-associated NlpC family hydrolase
MFTHDRRFTPARPDLAAESLRGLVDAPRYAAPRVMRVVDECAPVAPEPRRDVPIDTQALHGERVDVYELDAEGWAWGQLRRDGYVGYMPAECLREDAPPATHRVAVTRAHIYPAPNMKLPPVGALPLNAEVTAGAPNGDFMAVDGIGFVWWTHLVDREAHESDFVAVAERFLHAPYLWGGKTICGIDCSGLAQVSLAACGRAVPRDTDVMERFFTARVDVGDALNGLRRGDLVFWKGHVGVMRDASELLHANGHFMRVTSEPLSVARDRILAKGAGPITSIVRP